jgi:cell wall-associated NlpC family hydrolase
MGGTVADTLTPAVRKTILFILAAVLAVVIAGCAAPVRHTPQTPWKEPPNIPKQNELPRLGYTIQAGAFASAGNAAAFTRLLKEKGIDSTYFVARQGLYKVRFGNFASRELARSEASKLKEKGVIDDFYVVAPEQYAVAQRDRRGDDYLREELVKTARSFLGIDYLWGGESVENGFDCSGLTMTVYQLNGMILPRNSRQQFAWGNPVELSSIRKGDLIFFSKTGGKVSHVGIYIGDDAFIHAPGKGKKIRIDSLAKDYFRRTLVGVKSYL